MTPEQRATWGRIGGLTAQARYGSSAMTTPAREGFLARFASEVDPEWKLPPEERAARAQLALTAYMLRLAMRSAEARRGRGTS